MRDRVNLLLVEDSPDYADLVRAILEEEPGTLAFDVTHVERLGTALEALTEPDRFDIVLLDLGLPDSEGTGGLEKILERAGHTPVIVLTGLRDKAIGVDAVRLGAEDYIAKDLANGQMLVQAIRYALERSERTRELHREIEARKAAEASLRDSEQRLRDFGEAASDWFWESDAEGRLSYFSERFFEWSGLPLTDILDRRPASVFNNESSAVEWEKRIVGDGSHERFRTLRMTMRTADGTMRHLSLSGKPIFAEDGAFSGFRGTGSDVTEVFAAQRAAERFEGFLHRAIDNLNEGVCLYDGDDRLVICNARYLELYPPLKDVAVPGTSFVEILRAYAHSGQPLEAVGREEEFIAERLAQFNDPEGPRERTFADGREFLVSVEKFDGGSAVIITDITQLKEQQYALTRSAALIETTFHHMAQGILMLDANLEIRAFNHQYVELLGLPEDLVAIGTPVAAVLRYQIARGDCGAVTIKTTLRERLGSMRRGERRNGDIAAPGGLVVQEIGRTTEDGGYVLTYTDITSRARRLQELRLLMEASRAIYEAGDTDSALVAALRVICETWRWPYAEVWWPTPAGDALTLRTAWTDGDPKRLEFLELTKPLTYAVGEGHSGRTFLNNEPEWLPDMRPIGSEGANKRRQAKRQAGLYGALSVPIANQHDQPIGVFIFYTRIDSQATDHVVSIVGNIARQVGLYIDKKLADDTLRENQARFDIAAEAAGIGTWTHHIQEGRVTADDRIYAMYGIDPDGFEGTFDSWLALVHEDDRPRILAEAQAVRDGASVVDSAFRIVRPDGTVRHIKSYAMLDWDESGRPLQLTGANLDVTEQRETEHRLNHAQKMEAVGQLTGGVAHDFNNLLTVVMGNLQLLERRVAGDERQANQVRMALDATRRGAELTRRLLAFSRRQVLEPEFADINELVEGMVPLMQRTLGESIDFRTELAEELPRVRIDVSQFEGALLNLGVNARDAMPDGGLLLVETRETHLDEYYCERVPELTPGDYIVVSVSDTGHGIEPEVIEHVFEPFFTTKEVGQGSGLGLSMVYGFVKQSQGHATIYSEPGEGTTIRLYFPLEEAAAAPVAHCDDSGTESAAATGTETVLVVEDDEPVRITLETVLEDHGYRVVCAGNGPEATNLLIERDDIDLMLTDVVMPGGMNGRELTEQARRLKPEMKVLITSGYPRETISQKGFLADDIAFISKPYEHADLIRRIRELLDGD